MLWVMLIGNVALGAYCAALAYIAAKSGLSTVLMGRFSFGAIGSRRVDFILLYSNRLVCCNECVYCKCAVEVTKSSIIPRVVCERVLYLYILCNRLYGLHCDGLVEPIDSCINDLPVLAVQLQNLLDRELGDRR